MDLNFINCNNCDKEMCEHSMFTCDCNKLNCDEKCDLCMSNSYDCEVDQSFMIKCPLKKEGK